jgi:hypothetical protein
LIAKYGVWIRTAKTAGTSLQAALSEFLVPCGDTLHFEVCPDADFHMPERRIICIAPDTTDEVPRFIRTHDEVWSQAIRFAVVRNPYDRFISAWKYLNATRHRSLDDLLANLPRTGPEYVHLTMRQVDLLMAGGKMLDLCLLRFERLQEDFDGLCDMLGVPRRIIPELNRGKWRQAGDLDHFTAEDRRRIATLFQADFEMLGYDL